MQLRVIKSELHEICKCELKSSFERRAEFLAVITPVFSVTWLYNTIQQFGGQYLTHVSQSTQLQMDEINLVLGMLSLFIIYLFIYLLLLLFLDSGSFKVYHGSSLTDPLYESECMKHEQFFFI